MKKTRKLTKEQILIKLVTVTESILLTEIKDNLWLMGVLIIINLTFIIEGIIMKRFIGASIWFILIIGLIWLFVSRFRFYKSIKKSQEILKK